MQLKIQWGVSLDRQQNKVSTRRKTLYIPGTCRKTTYHDVEKFIWEAKAGSTHENLSTQFIILLSNHVPKSTDTEKAVFTENRNDEQ